MFRVSRLFAAITLTFLVFPAFNALAQNSGGKPDIRLPAETIQSGAKLEVTLSGLPGNAKDWVTLVRADAADSTFGQWSYTRGAREGVWTFNARQPGAYEVRVYFDFPAGGYTVQARQAVKVVARQQAAAPRPKAPPAASASTSAATATPFGQAGFATTLAGFLGQQVASADAQIKKWGYRLVSSANHCIYTMAASSASRRLELSTFPDKCGAATSPIVWVSATEHLAPASVPLGPEMGNLKTQLKAVAECSQVAGLSILCTWQQIPSLPSVKKMAVNLTTRSRSYEIHSRSLADPMAALNAQLPGARKPAPAAPTANAPVSRQPAGNSSPSAVAQKPAIPAPSPPSRTSLQRILPHRHRLSIFMA